MNNLKNVYHIMRPKNTSVTDRILDATLPNTLIVLVENTSFCKKFPFAVRNYIILWFFEHPLGSFVYHLGSFGYPLGDSSDRLGSSLIPMKIEKDTKG